TPLLSVIIPTFGRQALTEMAIRSVLNQRDLDGLELIIVDDGSQPGFVLPFELSDSRIRIVRHEENRGAAAARNTGLDNSTGEWISFLDSDDLLVENALAGRLAFARQNSGRGIAPIVYCCGFSHFTDHAQDLQTRIPGAASTPEDFASGCWFCPGS